MPRASRFAGTLGRMFLALVCQLALSVDAGLPLDKPDAGAYAAPEWVPPDPTWSVQAVQRTTPFERVEELLDDGKHWRFGTATNGAVHVWKPASYRPDSASVVIYLHGFYTDVDTAMYEHQLTRQFRDSARNALFIVPEARSWRTDPLLWLKLDELLEAVRKNTKVRMPGGSILVVAHSGGYRTVVEWLAHPKLRQLVLLDGLYGSDADFRKWLELPAGQPKQLVLVGFDTAQHVEWFLQKHPTAVRLDDLPYLYDVLPAQQAMAPLLYMQSTRFDHMGLVTSGKVLPYLLHALP